MNGGGPKLKGGDNPCFSGACEATIGQSRQSVDMTFWLFGDAYSQSKDLKPLMRLRKEKLLIYKLFSLRVWVSLGRSVF